MEGDKRQSGTHRHLLGGYLDEFLWRESIKWQNNKCPFEAMLAAISEFMPPERVSWLSGINVKMVLRVQSNSCFWFYLYSIWSIAMLRFHFCISWGIGWTWWSITFFFPHSEIPYFSPVWDFWHFSSSWVEFECGEIMCCIFPTRTWLPLSGYKPFSTFSFWQTCEKKWFCWKKW